MKSHIVIFTFFLSTFCFAQRQENASNPGLIVEQPAGPKPWTTLNIDDKPGKFQFVVVTDRAGGHRDASLRLHMQNVFEGIVAVIHPDLNIIDTGSCLARPVVKISVRLINKFSPAIKNFQVKRAGC